MQFLFCIGKKKIQNQPHFTKLSVYCPECRTFSDFPAISIILTEEISHIVHFVSLVEYKLYGVLCGEF